MAAGDLVTQPWHLEWGGQLFGWPLTSSTFGDVSGWLGIPGMRGSNADRPGRHGTYPGMKRAGERLIEVQFTVAVDDPAELLRIRNAFVLDEDPVEQPLVIWCGTAAPERVMARIERVDVPTDHEFSVGLQRATVQWVATDPKRYSLAENAPGIGLPVSPGGGIVFPLVFPLKFGAGQSGGNVTVTNTGNAAVWPQLEISGPITGPVITNTTTGQKLLFDPAFTVAAGQTLIVDTDNRAVEIAGVTMRAKLFRADWFPLLPKIPTKINFSSVGSYDPAALLTVRWRHGSM